MRPSRSGVSPWLKMMTPPAPAAWALCALRAKLQPPRWISAIAPAGKPAKSLRPPGSATSGAPTAASVNAPSHPLVFARGGMRLMSTGHDGGGDVAGTGSGERPGRIRRGDRRQLLQRGRRHEHEREAVERDVVAGGRHALDDVLDALLVARRAGRARPAVGVGDGLERGLVLADALERHALQQLLVVVVGARLATVSAVRPRQPVPRPSWQSGSRLRRTRLFGIVATFGAPPCTGVRPSPSADGRKPPTTSPVEGEVSPSRQGRCRVDRTAIPARVAWRTGC